MRIFFSIEALEELDDKTLEYIELVIKEDEITRKTINEPIPDLYHVEVKNNRPKLIRIFEGKKEPVTHLSATGQSKN